MSLSSIQTFNANNFHTLCDALALADPDLRSIIKAYGYPPLWSRAPTFHSLIHFILEQQVSLASAKAALNKLEGKLGEITPIALLHLSDEALRACYFSRQKISYARSMANAVLQGTLCLENLHQQTNEEVSSALQQVKGIGQWTAEVFLMMALHRCDVFATGDITLVKSIRQIKALDPKSSKQEIAAVAAQWAPYRTIAAYLLWHAYLQQKQKRSNKKAIAMVP